MQLATLCLYDTNFCLTITQCYISVSLLESVLFNYLRRHESQCPHTVGVSMEQLLSLAPDGLWTATGQQHM